MTLTEAQKRLVIVGATGMVGGYALRRALDHPAVGTATAIGRKPTGLSHPKLNEVLHQDFADCSALADVLSGQNAAVFCLGAYTGAVADAELHRITVDYTIEFARVLSGSSPNATFAFLSAAGADPTGRSRISYVRYKGEAEKALSAAGFPHVYIFRPANIYPVQPRREPNVSYRLLRAIYPAFRALFPSRVHRDGASKRREVSTGGRALPADATEGYKASRAVPFRGRLLREGDELRFKGTSSGLMWLIEHPFRPSSSEPQDRHRS